MNLLPKYQVIYDTGQYSSIEEMCQRLCINVDEAYIDYENENRESKLEFEE